MNKLNCRKVVSATLFICLIGIAASAKDATVETVLTGLQAPRGVAVRPGDSPEKYEIFVADTAAGRIVKVQSAKPGAGIDVVTGFASDAGPHGLHFVDRDQLAVGGDNPPAVRLYQIVDQAEPLAAAESKQQISAADAGTVVALARVRANDKLPDALVVAGLNPARAGWFGRIPVRAGTLGEFAPLKIADIDAPTGIAVSEQGFLVVSQLAAAGEPQNTRLTFINPIDGSPVMELPLALGSISGLAFSPRTGNLYAIASSSDAAPADGLYRIDNASQPGKPGCSAAKIAAIRQPTALAFAPDGALYITAFGKSESDESTGGSLVRITGGL